MVVGIEDSANRASGAVRLHSAPFMGAGAHAMWKRYLFNLGVTVFLAGGLLQHPRALAQRTAQPGSPPPSTPVEGATVTRLSDGHWLLVGGHGPSGPSATVSLFDPLTNTTIVLPRLMNHAREGHTATILPDGSVLIAGGRGAAGQLQSSAERFDPATETFSPVSMDEARPRAGHTATLLTDGRILIVGGDTEGSPSALPTELWNLDAQTLTRVAGSQAHGSQTATLLADGRVLIAGGPDATGATPAEIFDPRTNTVTPVRQPLGDEGGVLTVTEARPSNDATDVPLETMVTVRLSRPAQPDTVTDQTVTLSGPQGSVSTRIVPAEGGRLIFVRPFDPLLPDTTYVLTLSGVGDPDGVPLTRPR
jgi:hypothetical protein